MIKGIKKSVIVVEPPKKSSFEKIFFVMKVRPSTPCSQDMLAEANRIIGDSLLARADGRARTMKRRQLIVFGVGFAMGAALGMIAILLLV